ncbi:MAG: glycoside hydrolase family 127 protein [Candidatus Humimicrobiaceae bacterium]|jgi:DUF1680 family protein|nr:glycoside hydrolase family 127 protein [Actinomycetota bacterium]MDY0027901.1 glycoside hydrolase family 127 protein [Candidatus Humimicrobiaceae bacterium]
MISPLQLPSLNQITINDSLWSKYTDMVADVIVPYQWDILNGRIKDIKETNCVNNFRIAAGETEGEHRGVVFIDSDLYKWLEAVAYCLHSGKCRQFETIADEVIELIGRAQQSDGYLNTYYTVVEPGARWSNLVEGHELYCAGHLIEAAVAYYYATGKNKLLKIARRFADLICKKFGPGDGQIKGYPGHQEIELALIKLFHCTGEKRYLSCSKYFIEERGKNPNYFKAEIKKRNRQRFLFRELNDYDLKYSQSHKPVREQHTAEGHAVRAMYMYCAMADLALEYKDKELFETCQTLWQNVTQQRMYITGGIGSSAFLERFTTDYHLPNDYAYCETCASIGLALFGRRMFLIEQDANYYDTIERTLYNTILAGISLEGDRYFYSNPLEIWPEACIESTSLRHVKPVRQRWYDVACCPTNIARTLASLGQYIYAQNNEMIFVNLFISSSIKTAIGNTETELVMNSNLMQNGKVTINIKTEQDSIVTVAIRIPYYANSPVFLLDGVSIQPDVKKGYAYISENFKSGRTISLDLNIQPRWVSANLLVRENAGKVALMKGPCVYCLEEIDNISNLSLVYIDPENDIKECKQDEIPEGLPVLKYDGKRLSCSGRNGSLLYDDAYFKTEPIKLKAVPYGIWGNRKPGEMLIWQKAIIDNTT